MSMKAKDLLACNVINLVAYQKLTKYDLQDVSAVAYEPLPYCFSREY